MHAHHDGRVVHVEGIPRVEGEGSLLVEVRGGHVHEVSLEIFEPPRFFEALLRGRAASEAPDITARICGICPVAYQTSSCAAVESAYTMTVDPQIAALRRLLYCGEWIQSHALHVYLLHAPDFFGLDDAVELAALDRGAVERGLRLKRVGNLLMETVGGRAIHPVNVRIGGFYRAPDRDAVAALAAPLRAALADALATVSWVAGFEFPDAEGDYRFVALSTPDRYAIETGTVTTSDGRSFSAAQFAEAVSEEQVKRSTALHARLEGRPYLTGPLARYAINHRQLPPVALEAAIGAGLGAVVTNPFKSIVVRAVELVAACEEALSIVQAYEPPSPPAVEAPARAGRGFGVSEAPRGLLLIGYEIGEDGAIGWARIMPPTAQNQLVIEDDLRHVAEANLDADDHALTHLLEQSVRNHDPCISCAAHFLDLRVERG